MTSIPHVREQDDAHAPLATTPEPPVRRRQHLRRPPAPFGSSPTATSGSKTVKRVPACVSSRHFRRSHRMSAYQSAGELGTVVSCCLVGEPRILSSRWVHRMSIAESDLCRVLASDDPRDDPLDPPRAPQATKGRLGSEGPTSAVASSLAAAASTRRPGLATPVRERCQRRARPPRRRVFPTRPGRDSGLPPVHYLALRPGWHPTGWRTQDPALAEDHLLTPCSHHVLD